jgi:hypothetical protein
MRKSIAMLVSLALLLVFARQVRAQSAVQVVDVQVTYTFGEHITFSARFDPVSSVQEVSLFFQAEGDTLTHTVPLTLAADGTGEYRHLIQNGVMKPFAHIFFWYRLTLMGGGTFDTAHYYFKYDDNRFPWQTLEAYNLRVHWYAGDAAFGQNALDAAYLGLQTIQNLLPVSLDQPVDIFIYSAAADVQDTLGLGGYTWVAGHASPELNVVLVSVAPGEGQVAELQRQIPHELAHVLLYRMTGPSFANLPSWLNEGIASQAELAASSDYAQILSGASESKALKPIQDLCGLFPADASGAILAYAESASFTGFLHDTYGTSGLQQLVQAYAGGMACDQGTISALGVPLGQLDMQWRQAALGMDLGSTAIENLLPYFVVLALVLIVPAWRMGLALQKKGNDDANRER